MSGGRASDQAVRRSESRRCQHYTENDPLERPPPLVLYALPGLHIEVSTYGGGLYSLHTQLFINETFVHDDSSHEAARTRGMFPRHLELPGWIDRVQAWSRALYETGIGA